MLRSWWEWWEQPAREFHQVRKKSAEREMVCMGVSRFFDFPIQNNFSEMILAQTNVGTVLRTQVGPVGI